MIGASLLHYEITAKLGEGGMGEVYRARDSRLGRDVAIKVLPADFLDDSERVARLEQEARLLAALNHPNVATVFGLEEVEGALLLVMEWVEGEDLAQRIERGPLSVEETLRLGEGIAAALEAAHRHNIIHRDLKPANVMVTTEGEVKVLDFGIATAVSTSGTNDAVTDDSPTVVALTTAGELIGTAVYMSPEQARGAPATTASDVWGLGVLLYEALAGRRPFAGGNLLALLSAIREQEPEPLSELRPDAPPALVKLVESAMSKDPAHRQQSMTDLRRGLAELRSSAGSRRLSELVRKPWLIAAAVGIVALGGWLLVAGMKQRSEARWARETGIPEIARIADTLLPDGPADDAWRAVELAKRAEAAIPGDPTLAGLWDRILVESPPIEGGLGDVRLSARPYGAKAPWAPVALTPEGTIRLPLGVSRVRLERDGAAPMDRLMWTRRFEPWIVEFYRRPPPPEGMVRVRGRDDDAWLDRYLGPVR